MSDVRQRVNQAEPQLDVEFFQVLEDMIGDLTGSPEPVYIKLFSEDAALLLGDRPRVAAASGRLLGVVDELDGIENTISGPAVTFQVNPTVAAAAGFTPEEISTDAGAISSGRRRADASGRQRSCVSHPHPVSRGNRVVAYRNARHAAPQRIRPHRDAGIPDGIFGGAEQTEIRRQNLQREVEVTARLEGVASAPASRRFKLRSLLSTCPRPSESSTASCMRSSSVPSTI